MKLGDISNSSLLKASYTDIFFLNLVSVSSDFNLPNLGLLIPFLSLVCCAKN